MIYPRQTRDGALRLIAKAGGTPSKKAAKEILSGQSIRSVEVGNAGDDQGDIRSDQSP